MVNNLINRKNLVLFGFAVAALGVLMILGQPEAAKAVDLPCSVTESSGVYTATDCTNVTVVSTFAEPVWARYGEALIFLAGLITGVAIFWLLVGKVLKVLRLRRP